MTILQAIILAIVEGLTEFLPVSSTGHMVITGSLMGIAEHPLTKLFEICIQLGAILAVVVYYYKRFLDITRVDFYIKLAVAVIPALVLGKLLDDYIDQLLESPLTVAITLLLGGIVLLFVDKIFDKPKYSKEEDITNKKGLIIGFWQCVALIPGVSRSAASIIGGMQQGLTRSLAAEFSFFLAVPTMFAATGYKLYKAFKETPELLKDSHNLTVLAIGNVVAFIVAMLAIKFFIGYLSKYGFKLFGWYRIAVGLTIIILIAAGVDLTIG